MFPEAKVTGIYGMGDDFCKEFMLQQKKYIVEDKTYKHRKELNQKKPAIDVNVIKDRQLTLL